MPPAMIKRTAITAVIVLVACPWTARAAAPDVLLPGDEPLKLNSAALDQAVHGRGGPSRGHPEVVRQAPERGHAVRPRTDRRSLDRPRAIYRFALAGQGASLNARSTVGLPPRTHDEAQPGGEELLAQTRGSNGGAATMATVERSAKGI